MSATDTKLFQIRGASIEAINAFQKAASKSGKKYIQFFDEDIQSFCKGLLKKSEHKPAKPEDLATILDGKFEQFAKLMDEKNVIEKEGREEELKLLREENAELKDLIERISNANEEQIEIRESEMQELKAKNTEMTDILNKTLNAIEDLKDEKSKSFFKKLFS